MSERFIAPGGMAWRGPNTIVLAGLLLVLVATVLSAWPSDVPGQFRAHLVRHWERLLFVPEEGIDGLSLAETGPTIDWVWRRVWDGLHYVMLLSGLALVVWTANSERAWPWMGLGAVGVLGVGYTAGMALYNGPLLAAPGYLLVFMGVVMASPTWIKTAVNHDGAD